MAATTNRKPKLITATTQQLQVEQMITLAGQGHSTREIAKTLHTTPAKVQAQLQSLHSLLVERNTDTYAEYVYNMNERFSYLWEKVVQQIEENPKNSRAIEVANGVATNWTKMLGLNAPDKREIKSQTVRYEVQKLNWNGSEE